jgi:type VI secretion system protein
MDWGKHDAERTGDRIASVIDHLKKLLNARQGTTLMDPGFGMPDITDLRATFPDSVRDIERTLSRTIEQYEPRLVQVEVSFVEQDERMNLYFHIRALLRSDGQPRPIHLESALSPSGRMIVRH